MKSRRKAREATLQALYQCDSIADWSIKCGEVYFRSFQVASIEEMPPLETDNLLFARTLVHGVIEHLSEIDHQITLASTHWSIGRMSRVDRNILRMATFEIGFLADIPLSVCINEAIEVAKRFGSEDSPMFINGVLDTIAKTFAPNRERLLALKVANA